MHGEKPNSIKNKIDELHSVPEGFEYNHATTWQKLELNLQAQKRSNYRWWLYAAVFLFLVGSFLIWKMSTNSNEIIHNANKIVRSKERPTPKKILPGNYVQDASVTIPVVIHKSSGKVVERINKHAEKIIQNDTLESEVVASQNIIDVFPPLVIDTANTKVVEKTAKPKFRIAHLNELNRQRMFPLPSEEKNSIVFKKPLLSSMNEEPVSNEEKTVTRKKSRSVFSPVSSSQ